MKSPFPEVSMKSLITLFIIFLFTNKIGASPLILKPWQNHSSPLRMSKNFKKNFSTLPLAGQALGGDKYWSSDYWPLNKGNINYRWNAPEPIGFGLNSPDKEEVLRMDIEELKFLAPSEKFDLYLGKYKYPLKQKVGERTSPSRKEWEGICHGWAAATLNHNEPSEKIMTNSDGVKIPFGSSDIKALLSYYYAYHFDPVSTHQMGRRCSRGKFCSDDMNAGAFHIVLANKLGLKGESFIADIDRGREVWNHVVYSYRTEILDSDLSPARDSAKGTVKVIRVKTNMRVVFNIGENSWLPVRGTPLQSYRDEDYEYDLDIDKYGRIIGGDWRSKKRPDFLWLVRPAKKFTGTFSRLGELLND